MRKIDDLVLMLKADRRCWAAGAFLLAALLVWMATSSPKRRQQILRLPPSPAPSSMAGGEIDSDIFLAFRNDIEQSKRLGAEMFSRTERLASDLKAFKEQTAGIFETAVDRIEQLNREVNSLAAAVKTGFEVTPDAKLRPEPVNDGLVRVWEEEPIVAERPLERPLRVSVIAPGDTVTCSLLSGLTAPCEGQPQPVLLQLTGPVKGPNRVSLDLADARLIAAAQGSRSDNRAFFRLVQLSISSADGRRIVVPVDGWIVGEDGMRGMPGRLIDQFGRMLISSAAVSAAAAASERLEAHNRTFERSTPGAGPAFGAADAYYPISSAVSDSANRVGQEIMEHYRSLVPAVEVLSGREAVAVFTLPAEIGLAEEGNAVLAAAER